MSANTPKTGKPADREVLDGVARRLIDRYGIYPDLLMDSWEGEPILANESWDGPLEQLVLEEVKKNMSAELLGRIIFAEPNASLYEVHCRTWLGKYDSGPDLLRKIAATAVVARIRAMLGVHSGVTACHSHQTGASA